MQSKQLTALLALPLVLSTAYAQETPAVKVSGYGTGALTWTNTDDAQFVRPNQAAGVGKNPRTGVDSNLGLQVDATLNDWISFTGQGLVRKNGTDDYGADLMLAFAKFKLDDSLSVRAGRLPLALFMISDYRHIGYANIMLRPSQEVYSQAPLNSVDGVDLTWQRNFGDTTLTAQVAYGRSEEDIVGMGHAKVNDSATVNVAIEHGPLTFRIAHNDAKLNVNSPALRLSDSKVAFSSVGLNLDWNNIVAQSEYTEARSVIVVTHGWYAMGGYRFGKLLPFYSHGKLTGPNEQSTNSIGLRWDAFRSADIKFQIDRVKPVKSGLFVHPATSFHGPVTVAAVAIDFVF